MALVDLVMTYDGGKNADGVWHRIINQMPPHRAYIEPFLGSAAVMRRKRPAALNIGIEKDPAVFDRVKTELSAVDVELLCGDAMDLLNCHHKTIKACCSADTLIYADPPYLMETRSCKRDLYGCEFATAEQHTALLEYLDSLPCMVILSGYYSKLYNGLLRAPKWRTIEFQAMTHRGPRVEWLWMNYRDPVELHDYTCLGRDRTDRQRIKRKVARWVKKLHGMAPQERSAVFAACQEVKTELSARSVQTKPAAEACVGLLL